MRAVRGSPPRAEAARFQGQFRSPTKPFPERPWLVSLRSASAPRAAQSAYRAVRQSSGRYSIRSRYA
jgi:hypothetical protein